MTKFNLKDILKDVRIVLGHNDVSSAIAELTNDVDTLTLDEVIRREIYPAARQLLLVAPKERMEWKMLDIKDSKGQYVSEFNAWKVNLPSDFLRIGSAKLMSWMYPLSEITSIEELAYKKQFSDYAGMRATPKKPVMAIVEGVTDNIEFNGDLLSEEKAWNKGTYTTGYTVNLERGKTYKFQTWKNNIPASASIWLYVDDQKVCQLKSESEREYTPQENLKGNLVIKDEKTPSITINGSLRLTITNDTEVTNTLQLQMFGTNGYSDVISYVTICTLPKIVNEDNEEVKTEWDGQKEWKLMYSSTLYNPFVYMCASLVAKTLKDYNMSEALENTANNLMIDIDAARRDARLYGNKAQ